MLKFLTTSRQLMLEDNKHQGTFQPSGKVTKLTPMHVNSSKSKAFQRKQQNC